MSRAIFEFPDGSREDVKVPGRRYDELLADGYTPLVGPVLPIPDPHPQYATIGEVVAEVETPGSPLDTSLRATMVTRQVPVTPEAFNLPVVNSGTGVNPHSVIGYDATTGILFALDRTTNNISMSSNGGVTWQTGRGMPGDVNHVQLHKVVRFGAYLYLHAISGLDGRAGVYRAPAPAAATDTLTWDSRTNKVTNSNFDSGATGWTINGAVTPTYPTSGGYSGNNHARLTASSNGAMAATSTSFPVTPGQQFAFSAYVRGTPGQSVQVSAIWTGATTTGGGFVPLNSATDWQRITFASTVPAGATAVSVRATTSGTTVTGNVLDVDAVLGELDTLTINPYFATTTGRRYALMSASTSAAGPNFESLNGKSTAFHAGPSALMLGDYGDFASGPTIQRSLDGTTWTTVWSSATSRHVHAVAADPYNAGHWWATIGDGVANSHCVIRSTDNGATWTTVVSGTGGNVYQAVQISFDANAIYFAADHYGSTAFYMSRNEIGTMRNLTVGNHSTMPVPGGMGARLVTDLAITSGSKTVTSAALTSYDRGRTLKGDGIPLGGSSNWGEENYLTAASAGTGTLKVAATASGTISAVIGGDRFYVGSYMGAVDPATGAYYVVAHDTSSSGNTYALFVIPQKGAPLVLLGFWQDVYPTVYRPTEEVYVVGDYVYVGTRRYKKFTP